MWSKEILPNGEDFIYIYIVYICVHIHIYSVYLCVYIYIYIIPNGGVSLLGSFQIKNREEVDPKWRTTPKIDQFWGLFLTGGPLSPGSWFGNHTTNIPPGRGGFFRSNMWVSNQLPRNSMNACVPRFFHKRPSRPSNASSSWVAICEFCLNWLEFVEFCVCRHIYMHAFRGRRARTAASWQCVRFVWTLEIVCVFACQ